MEFIMVKCISTLPATCMLALSEKITFCTKQTRIFIDFNCAILQQKLIDGIFF